MTDKILIFNASNSTDINLNTVQNFILTTTNSIGEVFLYKDELYLTTALGFKKFTILNNNINYESENQGQFIDDNKVKCNGLVTSGYDCNQLIVINLTATESNDVRIAGGLIMYMYMYMVTDGNTPIGIMSVSNQAGTNYSFLGVKPFLHKGYGASLNAFASSSFYLELPDNY